MNGPFDVTVDLGAVAVPLRAVELFGRSCPVELEIGVGKGRFLLESAQARPDVGFLGVERARKYLLLAAQRAARRGLANLRLVHSTAEDLLFRCLAEGSVEAVHVYFPDPWPKKRHAKRRLVNAATVRRIAEVLVPGGMLRVKTDHADYAVAIRETLAAEPHLTEAAVEPAFEGIPETSFEVKYGREARVLYRFAFRRTVNGSDGPSRAPRLGELRGGETRE